MVYHSWSVAILLPRCVVRQNSGMDFALRSESSKGSRGEIDAAAFVRLRDLPKSLKAECDKIGRDYSKMEISDIGPAELDTIKRLRDEGVSRVMIGPPAFEPEALL